jgi:hypothetical protein
MPAPAAVSPKRPHGGQELHASPAADLEPLSRRLLQVAGVLSLLLILVVINSLINQGGASPFNPNPVAAAAERTATVPGMRIDLTMTMSTEATGSVVITGKGAYNGETNLAEIAYGGSSAQGGELQFDAILGEDAWYFRYPELAGKMPEGKEWLKLEGFPGQKDMSAPGAGSPDESLQMLRVAGAVRRLGEAKVGGAQTTRYRVTMTPTGITQGLRAEGKDELAEQVERGAAEMVGPLRGEVFITSGGMLRRMRMASTSVVDGKTVATMIQMTFSDFGIKPPIAVPDDSQVYDLSPLLEERLDELGQAS